MTLNDIKKVAVAGAGAMGRQIALNCAIHGYDTYLTDSFPAALEKAAAWAKDDYLAGRIAKGKMTQEQVDAALAHFHCVATIDEAVAGAQLLIEAIIEDQKIKSDFYQNVNKLASKDCILASNSSYMPSSRFKDCVDNPARLANFHYFNPALVMKVVEVVKGEHTAQETVDVLYDFAKATGKNPVRVNKEIRGFIVNRVLTAIRDEAYRLVESGVCSPEDLDIAVKGGLGHPMGVFELLDVTGIDVNYLSMVDRINGGEPTPPGFAIAKAKYEAGELGRKTGKGFYTYNK